MQRVLIALSLLPILLSPTAKAQKLSLPGCEAPAAVRKTIQDQLHGPEFNRLPYAEQMERKQQVLGRLIERYPRQVEPYRLWIAAARQDRVLHPEQFAALQKEYRARAAAHSDDPLALYIAANALQGTDTPESLRLLNRAQSEAPDFPWPALDLADLYVSGKFADKAKFDDQLTKFWTLCPTSQNAYARGLLVRVPALEAKVAKTERIALAKTTDPERLQDYGFLWGMEFRNTPPQQFPELRRQVAADVKRLEQVKNPHPDAKWAQLLIDGNKQAEAGPQVIAAREDALIAEYPHSVEAYSIARKRWDKAHPDPTDAKDAAAWKTHHAEANAEHLKEIRDYTEVFAPAEFYRLEFLFDDDSLNEQQGLAMVDAALGACEKYFSPSMDCDEFAGDYLLDHKWAPERALALLQHSAASNARDNDAYLKQDNHSDSDLKQHATSVAERQRYANDELLLAAMRAHRPDAVASIQSSVEAPRAADDKDESDYWLRRARLAVVEGHQQDALGYYQLALRTRPKPPSYSEGKLTDDLGDEAHALWTERGGTEVAWAAFSQPNTSPSTAKADDARWEKPTKTLPEFQLADLSGKTWTVKKLNGKVVLINLWATWCGPCNAELPQLQKLYEQAKDRSDVQILTFNMDEDLGLVEPFMKEKGYTFPVVPAYSYVYNLLNGYAIPQNWVLNPKGDWEWTQIGYGSDDAWVKDMLAKLDAVKAGS